MFFKGLSPHHDSIYAIPCPNIESAFVKSSQILFVKHLCVIRCSAKGFRTWRCCWLLTRKHPDAKYGLKNGIRIAVRLCLFQLEMFRPWPRTVFHFHLQFIHSHFPSAVKVASMSVRPLCLSASLLFILAKVKKAKKKKKAPEMIRSQSFCPIRNAVCFIEAFFWLHKVMCLCSGARASFLNRRSLVFHILNPLLVHFLTGLSERLCTIWNFILYSLSLVMRFVCVSFFFCLSESLNGRKVNISLALNSQRDVNTGCGALFHLGFGFGWAWHRVSCGKNGLHSLGSLTVALPRNSQP